MTVKDILNRKVITISPSQSLKEAMQILLDKKISCLPVMDGESKLLGIISDKDIFRKAHETDGNYQHISVGDCMTTDLIIGLPTDDISYIAGVMTENRIRHVPICEEGEMIGLVSIGDVVKTQMEHIRIENRYLKQYIRGDYPG